jgi:two-component system sensor histidine kinase GlrK
VGDGLQIDVVDQGPGVAEADRERIFEPFYRGRVQPEGGLAGTGIGLSIVAETVAAHGGRVLLIPAVAPHTGAHFRIELPHAIAN